MRAPEACRALLRKGTAYVNTKFPVTVFTEAGARCWARNGTGCLRGSFKAFANLLLISLLQPAGRARLAGREAVGPSCRKGLPPPPAAPAAPGAQRGDGEVRGVLAVRSATAA